MQSGRIADPLHGYLNFTGLERAILGHRVTQRLRYISQNGLTHLIYPGATTSRFIHSLGAMNLASRFLASALKNCRPNLRKRICSAAEELVESIKGQISSLPEVSGLGTEPLLASHSCGPAAEIYLTLIEQGLRLAALFHDLGHFPYSHDFEYGLREYGSTLQKSDRESSPLKKLFGQELGLSQPHEILGHSLALLLFQDLFEQLQTSADREAIKISFELAYQILQAPAESNNAKEALLVWLHSLVDGEVDADRSDYILRDGANFGLDFASYDLERLIYSFTVVEQGNALFSVIGELGVSALESFLLARYRFYQYGVRHHKVAQIGTALRFSICRLLQAHAATQLKHFAEDIGVIVTNDKVPAKQRRELLDRFAGHDDIWWMQFMREGGRLTGDEWLDLVCWRRAGPKSLWKRVANFPKPLRDWNEKIPGRWEVDRRNRWDETVRSLAHEGVLVVRHEFNPWKSGQNGESIFQIQGSGDNIRPMSGLSPMIRGLKDVWMSDIQVHAFAIASSTRTADEVIALLERA